MLYAIFIDSLPRMLATTSAGFDTLHVYGRHKSAHRDLVRKVYHRCVLRARSRSRIDSTIVSITALLYADDVVLLGASENIPFLLGIA